MLAKLKASVAGRHSLCIPSALWYTPADNWLICQTIWRRWVKKSTLFWNFRPTPEPLAESCLNYIPLNSLPCLVNRFKPTLKVDQVSRVSQCVQHRWGLNCKLKKKTLFKCFPRTHPKPRFGGCGAESSSQHELWVLGCRVEEVLLLITSDGEAVAVAHLVTALRHQSLRLRCPLFICMSVQTLFSSLSF